MTFLKYISDDDFVNEVKTVLDVAIQRKSEAEDKFNDNVIDPFGALFESTGFDLDHDTWKKTETVRQCQKTLNNRVGTFHQNILGYVNAWNDLGKGSDSGMDLECEEEKIIAEVKNKHNTVTGGKLADQYYALESVVMPKASKYKGYTAYFVNIIPAKPDRINIPFTPPDKETGEKCPKNEKIRIIDGASFYEMVTGREFALKELYDVLPRVIEHIYINFYEQEKYKVSDKELFSDYFSIAYEKQE